mmetsp:Transcript_134532/g.335662  ORF Transcript_134532/g.335662 Transcript_134532/m.335662 type:complete len:502 (-) Transcript_134532:17-1522(-)
MAAAKAAPIGAEWLATNGPGRVPPEKREALKAELLRELSGLPGVRLPLGALAEEVDSLIEANRISESNLGRLQRRVLARSLGGGGGGAQSARSDAASVAARSEFSVGAASSVLSARQPAAATGPRGGAGPSAFAATPRLSAVPELAATQPQGPINKWSDIAKYSKTLEVVEAQQKRDRVRTNQEQMARDLQQQMAIKSSQKKAYLDDERKHFEQQEAEIQKWKDSQAAKEEEVRRRAMEEKKEREVQNAANQKRRDEERQAKMNEDMQLVQRAAKDLDQERQQLSARKADSRARQKQMMLESTQNKQDVGELKRIRHEEERKKVDEYHRMLEEQEIRNRPIIPPIRGVNAVIVGPPGGRRGEEFYTEENVMRQLQLTNEQADRAERDKIRNLKEQKQTNQDYLFQQIAERNKNRERALEQKRNQKQQAQAASVEYQEIERRRIEDARSKNIQYRLDLEQQIAEKKAAVRPKTFEDHMTPAERAINQHLIKEAEELRHQVTG